MKRITKTGRGNPDRVGPAGAGAWVPETPQPENPPRVCSGWEAGGGTSLQLQGLARRDMHINVLVHTSVCSECECACMGVSTCAPGACECARTPPFSVGGEPQWHRQGDGGGQCVSGNISGILLGPSSHERPERTGELHTLAAPADPAPRWLPHPVLREPGGPAQPPGTRHTHLSDP